MTNGGYKMINYIGKITLYVEDQQEAIQFWTEKMGFVCHEQPMGPHFKWVEVKPNEEAVTSFVLYNKELMKSQNPNASLGHPSIILSTQDIEATHNEMKEKGIKVTDIMSMPYGKMFTFHDQDDNSYLIRED